MDIGIWVSRNSGTELTDGPLRQRRRPEGMGRSPACAAALSVTLLCSLLVLARPAAAAPSPDLWLSSAELASLPTSGPAWERVRRAAEGSLGRPDVADQNSDHDVNTLAVALVAARLDSDPLRGKARDAIIAAIGSESGGRTLALARNLPGYVIAADLIGLGSFDRSADEEFRSWLRDVRTRPLDGRTLVSTHEQRPNNWGTHAGAARIAAALYLDDRADLDRAATVFRGWLGDRDAYAGFRYGGDLSWQADGARPVGINPTGSTLDGHDVDGVLPDDQRRSDSFTWPPPEANYVWGALQGAVVQAELLSRAGYDSWEWSDRALLRAVQWLHRPHFDGRSAFVAAGDDAWIPWLVNDAYGSTYPAGATSPGKNMGWTDWTHGGG